MSKRASEKKLLVAVIDDHKAFLSSICRLLELRGMATCAFDSVVKFINSPDIRRVDCLILDVAMPDIDGFVFHDTLRNTNYRFPVILCTGLAIDEAKAWANTHGAYCALSKPVEPDLLIETIRNACTAQPS